MFYELASYQHVQGFQNKKMFNPDTDLIFPPRVIPALSNERGPAWQNLFNHTDVSAPESPDQIAFILLMARLNNCATCNSDSYRAIHGCTSCSRQSLKRFHGSDKELVQLFKTALDEITEYLAGKTRNGLH
jgi:hypothetical protein